MRRTCTFSEKQLASACPSITFHLPRNNQITDYVRYRMYFPRMPSATACAWIETTTYSNDYAAIASYATSTAAYGNEFLMIFEGASKMTVYISGHAYSFNVPRLDSGNKVNIYSQKMLLISFSVPCCSVKIESRERLWSRAWN